MAASPSSAGTARADMAWVNKGTAGAVFAGAVSFENVSFEVRGRPILHSISLDVVPGKITSLLGPSGCGKTTLLRLVAGVARPTQGRILIDGLEVAGPARFVVPERRNVGLMFQDYALFPHMTVLDNVAYGLHALDRQDSLKAARRALERVGLLALSERFPSAISGGEQQRVALARAIVPRPQVILMDEPFSGLDMRLRDTVRAETLDVIRETQATAVLVTHDPHEAIEFADQIFLMREGRIAQHGTPKELHDRPIDAAAARFFSEFNSFDGTVRNGCVATPVGEFAVHGMGEGTAVDVLLKPEAFALAGDASGIEGHVLSVRYMGERQRLKIAVAGHDVPIDVIVGSRTKVAARDNLRFSLKPSGVFVFKKSKAAPM